MRKLLVLAISMRKVSATIEEIAEWQNFELDNKKSSRVQEDKVQFNFSVRKTQHAKVR